MPDTYTIQQAQRFSCTPRYEDGTIGRRPSVLRVYAIADVNGGWHVMPGGFTRMAAERQATVSMQYGGSSVDTWVLSSQPTSTFTLLPSPMQPADLARKHRTVSSRAAENLFWAGRYGERAENNVRLLRLILGSLEGNDADAMFPTLVELAHALRPRAIRRHVLAAFAASVRTRAGRESEREHRGREHRPEPELPGALEWRSARAAVERSLAHDSRGAQRLPRCVADADAGDGCGGIGMQRQCTQRNGNGRGERYDRYDRVTLINALERLSVQLSAISGAQGDRMTRDEAWRLLFVGRHIERVSAMTSFLRVRRRQRPARDARRFRSAAATVRQHADVSLAVSGPLRSAGACSICW